MVERRQKFVAGDFKPASARSAKNGIEIRYYLNSADERALRAEMAYVRKKARSNLKTFKKKLEVERKRAREDEDDVSNSAELKPGADILDIESEDGDEDDGGDKPGNGRSSNSSSSSTKGALAQKDVAEKDVDDGLIFQDGRGDEIVDGSKPIAD